MNSMSRLCSAAAGLAVLAVAAAAGVAPAWAADMSPALKALVTAADKEGRLDLSWGSTLMGGNEGAKEITAAMNKMFGTKIEARFTPGPNANESLNAVLVANGANRPSPTDVFIGSNQHGALIFRNKLGLTPDWLALLPGRITRDSIEADGMALRTYTALPGGIVYNTQRAPYPPTSLADLLKPEWKGKIASTPYASGFDLLSASDVWGEEKTLDFAKKLSAQIGGLMRCNELERIASGEFIAYAMDCIGRDWTELAGKGAPIKHVVPSDFAAVRFNYMSVPKNAAHPNAATLFITFLHTPEGQKLVWKHLNSDLHTYPDGEMRKVVGEYEKKNIKFHLFTIDWYLKHPEARAGLNKAVKILTQR